MSLPAYQQRVLDTIENTLKRREPRLASMFAMFTRLNTNEAIPRTELLEAVPWWAWRRPRQGGRRTPRSARRPATAMRAALLVPVMIMAVVSAVILGMAASQDPCVPATGPHGPVVIQSNPKSCPSGSGFGSFGHGP